MTDNTELLARLDAVTTDPNYHAAAAAIRERDKQLKELRELAEAHCDSGGRNEHYRTEEALRKALEE